jgi:plastocyanin
MLVAALLAAALPVSSVAQQAEPTTIHIRDDKFVPAAITVRPGTAVTFINDDDDAHTVTADDQSWDSEGLNQGQKWTRTFSKTGKITYHCTVHPFMHGTIVVRNAS